MTVGAVNAAAASPARRGDRAGYRASMQAHTPTPSDPVPAPGAPDEVPPPREPLNVPPPDQPVDTPVIDPVPPAPPVEVPPQPVR